jgi:hypothetical protein
MHQWEAIKRYLVAVSNVELGLAFELIKRRVGEPETPLLGCSFQAALAVEGARESPLVPRYIVQLYLQIC